MSQIITKFITDLAVTTAKLAALSVTDAKVATGIDAAKIGGGAVSNTEFGYLDGVTSAIQTQLNTALAGATYGKETFVLSGTNITNQYVDLAQVIKANSLDFAVSGLVFRETGTTPDYSVSLTGGAGGKTRVSFLNDLATGGIAALVAADVLYVKYSY